MRCANCRGSVSAVNFFIEKKCPACGEPLKRMPTKEQVRETLVSFAEDKGYIFWSIVYMVVLYVVGFVDQIMGKGGLFEYAVQHKFRTMLCAVYSGSIIDYVAKANVEVTAVRNKFIFRPPSYLRNYRRWTNIFLVAGFGMTVYAQIKWPGYIEPIPSLTIICGTMLGLIWAIMGLALTDDDMNDKRIRYFCEEMRIGRVKYFHRAAAIYIGGITLAGILYYNLVRISGLWFYIYNSRLVYSLVTFFTQYFGWVKKFQR